MRLPVAMLGAVKVLANARDVPYQSLLKVFLAERLAALNARAIDAALARMTFDVASPKALKGRCALHVTAESLRFV